MGQSIGVLICKTWKNESPRRNFRLSEAAQKYLEQYGDPIVMNTYLKLTILVLAAVSLVTLSLFYRAQMALSTIKPLVIRINDVGRAEAIDYQNFAYRPQEAENRYFLSEWARDYYSRNHYTIRKDFTNALYFLNGDLQNAILEKYRKEKVIDSFLLDSSSAQHRHRGQERRHRRSAAAPVPRAHRVLQDPHQPARPHGAEA